MRGSSILSGFTLNEAQRQAVMHRDGPLLVVAGPGSGEICEVLRLETAALSSVPLDLQHAKECARVLVQARSEDAVARSRFVAEGLTHVLPHLKRG